MSSPLASLMTMVMMAMVMVDDEVDNDGYNSEGDVIMVIVMMLMI